MSLRSYDALVGTAISQIKEKQQKWRQGEGMNMLQRRLPCGARY
jgi:hypothetical protein